MDNLKKVGRQVVDTGSKTMLKTDVLLLEREIKQRKQKFGVEVYDSMEELEIDNEMTLEQKEQKIRLAFDRARKDIAVLQAKMECKKEEILLKEAEQAQAKEASSISQNIPPSSGNIIMTNHPTEMEYGFR